MEDMNGHLHKSDYRVVDIPLKEAQRLVALYHYARGGSNTRIYTHGLVHREDPTTVLGCTWWMPVLKCVGVSAWDGDWKKVINLSRLVVAPGMPTNTASFLLATSIKRIRKDGRFDCLLTYADEAQGHTGRIYLATNWEYLGPMPGSPRWVDPQSGRIIATRTGCPGVTRRASEMSALGYVRSDVVYPKHKYRMILRRKPLVIKPEPVQLSLVCA